jgi:hypothetical protein
MTDTDLHPQLRPLLFSIAYRMIGSVQRGRGRRPGGLPVLVNGVPGRLARDGEGNAVAVLNPMSPTGW